MSETGVIQDGDGQQIHIDPFAHLPGIASRIVGLGGNVPGHDATYVFHTAYLEVAPGPAHFTVKIEGLRAKHGTLLLRVHMLPRSEGAHAVLATSERQSFNRLIQNGGQTEVRFEAFRNVTYALYGSIPGDTDAEADSLTVSIDRPAGNFEEAAEELAVDPQTSRYGRDTAKPAAFMISLDRPRLAVPTCQMATLPQLAEPAAAAWLSRPALAGIDDPARRWSAAYILQTLSCFGMLASGARGLGIGWDAADIAAVAASTGTTIDLIAPADEQAPAEQPEQSIRWLAADPRMLGPEIVNYDFAWSAGTASALGTIAQGVAFVRDIVARLRPGGIAVHVMAFNMSSAEETIERGDTVLYRRGDLERIVLTAIAHGHEAAQIRIDARDAIPFDYPGVTADAPLATLCGIMIRKAATAL